MPNENRPGWPKYATARNPARPTLGPLVAKIDEIITGDKFMPWQRWVTDVAWELDPEHPGELYYTEGDITVPRQAGKSKLLEAWHRAGAVMFNGWQSYMTAQTGKDAGKRWRSLVDGLDLAKGNRGLDWKILRGKGQESAEYLPQGSRIMPFPPTDDALHGDHNNLVSIDEMWAFSIDEGIALETAAKPGFLTVPLIMLVRCSTMGTANSAYMNQALELGRRAVKDPQARRFYFEWSAPDEIAAADPYSDEALAFHPAIGHTQTARRIRDLGRGMPVGEWRRSFLNLLTQSKETVIDLAAFDARRWNYDPDTAPAERYKPAAPNDIVIAFDIAPGGTSATIYAGWLDPAGFMPCVEQVATAPGTEWLTGALRNLARRGYRRILTDDSGPNRTILQDLPDLEMPITTLSFKEYATACQSLLDRIRSGEIEHDGAPALIEAIENAALKDTSSALSFDPKKSAGAIDALRAMAIAQDGAARFLKESPFVLV
ncbi:hypothetical protein PWJ82_03545 [Actinotignum schaalii]|uniref:hypothetical protein n=1 Tax=Actinotignum schaalii TaxID=59505 RepID=UPI00237D9BD1|nr:hypothetical protein [Actinotignum schaalii]MDE1654309.1 hypothetical protein [Actinotignum schaalii]